MVTVVFRMTATAVTVKQPEVEPAAAPETPELSTEEAPDEAEAPQPELPAEKAPAEAQE